MLSIHFDLAQPHAVVHCETADDAAALIVALRRALPNQHQLVEVTEPPKQLPRASASKIAPSGRRYVRGRPEEEKRAMQRERRKRWEAKRRAAQESSEQRSPVSAPPPPAPSAAATPQRVPAPAPSPPPPTRGHREIAETQGFTRHQRPLANVQRPDWFPELLVLNGKVRGVGKAVLACFQHDSSMPLPKVAQLIWGNSSGQSMNYVRVAINKFIADGKLKRAGAGTYEVTTRGLEALERKPEVA